MDTAFATQPSSQESTDSLPMSFAQERLWFLDQLHPSTPLYNVPAAWRITGHLKMDALEKSLETILSRHESLRTVYHFSNESPTQTVLDRFTFDLPVIDLGAAANREEELSLRLQLEARKPFDLGNDLMMRALLFKLGPAEHVLFLNVHHIAFDEWSRNVLLRELGICYRAFCAGSAPQLAELPIQYADYALWQREEFAKGRRAEDLAYWQRKLGGELPRLELAPAGAGETARNCPGARQCLTVPGELTAAVRTLARKEGVTLHVLLLAVFETLLHRYSSAEEIIIGTPVAGRTHFQTEPLIGFFVNTLALRTDLSGDPTFRELMARIREVNLQALAHQEFPFEKIVELLQPERSSNQNPFFDVVFAVQNQGEAELEFSDLKWTPIEVTTDTAKFGLTFVVRGQEDKFVLLLEYGAGMIEAEGAKRLLGHFQTLLQGITVHPEERISKLPLLTAAERSQIVDSWNQTATPYPKDKTVDQLFEEQARRTPNAIAVVYGASELTYRNLNERANQLANRLRKMGVGPDVLVGVFMDRSIEMILSWLAILKAGGAYVPLDLNYPEERLSFMAEDSAMPVVLTKSSQQKRVPAPGAQVIRVDSDWKTIALEEKTISPSRATAENLAYVIYTSGSTGQPKGAAIVHRGIARLVFETNYIHLDSTERIAQLSNSSFDAATFEVWGALLHGGTLVGVPRETLLSPVEFASFLERQRITSLFLTVALFNQISADTPSAFHSVKNLLIGGDAVDAQAAKRVLQSRPPKRLVNGYGPTESTTFACWDEIKSIPEKAGSVPIGLPLSNTNLYILDGHLQPLPVGIAGELHIGGDGLARGYLNRSQLTAERFIPNPFSGDPHARLYKTGDRARYLPDGRIEFLGRSDHQVKIRGFRIELGEIESVLRQYAGIREAVVIMVEETAGDKRLMAYLRRDDQGYFSTSALREFLKRKLPDYMVPSVLVELKSFPLTPNGKVDRRALPRVNSIQKKQEDTPQTHLQSQLQKIWAEILGRSDFGPRDNFFEIGGHSLLAVRLIAQIEKVIGKRLPLPILFQAPTIEKLAEAIRETGDAPSGSSLVEIQPHGSRPPMFWLHTLGGGGGGGFFTYRKLANLLGKDQPSYGFVAPAQPLTTIEEMAAHYIEEMRAIQPSGPYRLGGYCFGGVVAYEMARQLETRGESVSVLALLDSSPPDISGARTRPSVRLALHFAKTLPWWLGDLAAQGPKPMWKTLRAIGLGLKRKWRRIFVPKSGMSAEASTASKLEELIDMSNYPADYRQFALVHWNALMNYTAQPIRGRAILFKTGERHLLRLDAVQDWRSLVGGGLTVRKVTGRHEETLDEPHVGPLARYLKEELDSTPPVR